MRARIGTALTALAGKPRSSITAAIGIETFIVSGLPHALGHAVAETAREQHVRAAHAARVGQLEDALRARVERPVERVAEARRLARRTRGAPRAMLAPRPPRASPPAATRSCASLEQPRAGLGGAEDDRAAAEDPGRDRALQRVGVGRERHARGDVRGHHPVLGDRDEQQVEEVALVLASARSPVSSRWKYSVKLSLPIRSPRQVAAAHLDPVGIGLADVADGGAGLADLHRARRYGPGVRASRPAPRAAMPAGR